MKENLHIIPLRIVPHNERHAILTAYTLERGMMAFLQPAGQGKEAARRRALLMPLSLIEGVADIRPGRDIHTIGQIQAPTPLLAIRSNPVKSSLAMFIAEVLLALLRESHTDATIWHFVKETVITLDTLPQRELANLHIAFLVRMMSLIGIMPDISTYSKGKVFDMKAGVFRDSAPLHPDFLNSQQSALLPRLAQINYINMHLFRLGKDARAAILDGLLHYYTIHYAAVDQLKSLNVIRMIF